MVDYNKESMEDFRKRMLKQAETGEPLSAHDQVTLERMEFCSQVATVLNRKFSREEWEVLSAASVVAIPWAEEKN